ncbi:MAG: DNA gyrase subunit A, partial [Planctomycetota bacterium]
MSDQVPGDRRLLIEDEMKESYLTYAMSVLVDRALPDIRDGLKPVHRRILYSMRDLNLNPGSKYQKSAKIVGQCIGNYHPHGDSAVYDAMVRMAQPFSLRYCLVDGQGNFGSIDGDSAAAYRYTEARMTAFGAEMLADIQYDTVDERPNFDESRDEPVVLPSRIPNLLINGSSGIAVGMATNIPPHNLVEVCEAAKELIHNPACTVLDLMRHIRAPDFPTGGFICGTAGARQAYETGRGRVIMRARVHTEEVRPGVMALVVTEVPYAIKLATILESIVKADKDERIKGIANMYGGTVKEGIRLVLELKRGEDPDLLLNQLWKHTHLQTSFPINMIALDGGRPRTVGLKRLLQAWVEHRKEVIVRRTRFLLARDEARLHIVQGLLRAIDVIDEIIAIIRSSASSDEAKQRLIDVFDFSDRQAQAILDMQLRRLTGLERDKLQQEHDELVARISEYREILGSERRQYDLILEEIDGILAKASDERRSEIISAAEDFEMEDLIEDEDCLVTLTNSGYIKRIPVGTYRIQGRGGKGVRGGKLKDSDDFVSQMYLASTHQYLLVFTSAGRMHWLKVYQIPQAQRTARGTHLANILSLEAGEGISTVIPVRDFSDDHYLFLATAAGRIKKTPLSAYSRPRQGGIKAVRLNDDDSLIGAAVTDGKSEIMLVSSDAQACRFHEDDCRPMGRDTAGVQGMSLSEGARVVSLLVLEPGRDVLTMSSRGYGKRTALEEYRLIRRGGKGVSTFKEGERNGQVVAALAVQPGEHLMLISRKGMVVRTRVDTIGRYGRQTQGVRVIALGSDDELCNVARCADEECETGEGENPDLEVEDEGDAPDLSDAGEIDGDT